MSLAAARIFVHTNFRDMSELWLSRLAIWLLVALFLGFIVAVAVAAAAAARKRRAQMANLAARLGFHFQPDRDPHLAKRFGFLNRLNQGSDQYAFNVLAGVFQNQRVLIFDYHFAVNTGKHRAVYHISCFLLYLPGFFPELTIAPEGLFSKLGKVIGFGDIDFESAEFSRAFAVRSRDKKFAYDVCHPRMMEYLLANRDVDVEIDRNLLAICLDGQLSPPQIQRNLARLLAIRSFLPNYLFTKA
jgi:hypothetical protein